MVDIALKCRREVAAAFVWQHFLLLISLFLMTLGVALCVRSQMGNSVMTSLPFAFSLAGAEGMQLDKRIGWYDRVLAYHPGFLRYGFARYIYR